MVTDALLDNAVLQDPSRAPSHATPTPARPDIRVVPPPVDQPAPAEPSSPATTSNTETTPANESAPTVFDFNETILSGDVKVELSDKARETIKLIFKQRLDAVKRLDNSAIPDPTRPTSLRDFDRILTSLGPDTLKRFESNTFTKADFALAWVLITQQAEMVRWATGTSAEVKKSIFRGKQSVRIEESGVSNIPSDYSRTIGIDEWTGEAQNRYLGELSKLQLTLEQSILTDSSLPTIERPTKGLIKGFPGRFADYFGMEPRSSLDLSLGDPKSGHLLRDRILDFARQGLRATNQELSTPEQFAEAALSLIRTNPQEYNRILLKAIENAYMDIAEDRVRDILTKPETSISSAILEKRAAEFETPATQETVIKAQQKATEAQTALTEAEAELKKFTDPEEEIRRGIVEQKNKIKDIKDIQIADIEKEIEGLEQRRDRFENNFLQTPQPTTADAKNLAEYEKARAQSLQAIAHYDDLLRQLHTEHRGFRIQQAEAERLKLELEGKRDALEVDQERKDKKEEAEKKLKKGKENAGKANRALEREKRRLSGETTTDEIREQAASIRDIKRARDENFRGRIAERLFAPGLENEFAVVHLADTAELDGKITGAERIRELVFGTGDPKYYQDHKDRFRKIWSDKAIADAIIWIYQATDPEILALQAGENSSAFLKKVLPLLQENPRVKVYDLMRFLINESVKSAALGNPNLEISGDYRSPLPNEAEAPRGTDDDEFEAVRPEDMEIIPPPRGFLAGGGTT